MRRSENTEGEAPQLDRLSALAAEIRQARPKRRRPAKFHPLAKLFPLAKGRAFKELTADIKANGLNEPMVLFQGSILDGRNRYRACVAAKVKPHFRAYKGKDPLAFVISANLARRHLGESQRAMVAAELAKMPAHRPSEEERKFALLSDVDAAALLNVSERSVEYAKAVLRTGDARLIEAVRDSKIKVSVGASLAAEAPKFRAAVVNRIKQGLRPTEAIRQTRKEFLPAAVTKLPAGVYRVIYADPPWQYKDARRTDDHRQSTGAFDHYGDMTIEELCALDVKAIAAEDSVLLMWGTFPLLPETLRVVEAWGFVYKTAFVWDKGHGSFGHYHDAEAEFMIVATRGSCTPDSETKDKQIQRFMRGEHSKKPEEWRALIDRVWVHGPRVELFRRGDVPAGWTTWGAEAEAE